MENCFFADINLRLDRRTRHASRNRYYMILGELPGRSFGNVILSFGIRFPSALLSRQTSPFALPLSFSSRRIAIMLILTTKFIAPFRSGASMRWTWLRKNDGKSFRFHSYLRFTLSPFDHTHIPRICSASLYTTPTFFGRHSRSNASTFGIRVLEIENAELHYMSGERVSSTQSRVFALTTPVSRIKGAGY